jgi:hypothetical protein
MTAAARHTSGAGAGDRVGWRLRSLVAVGVLVLRMLALTWRREVRRGEYRERLDRDGVAFIYALPHGHLLPLLWYHRRQGVAVVVSEHRDGEIIAQVARRLGYRTVRGSTTRGAARALLGVIRELEEGHPVAFTPDGPRGPAGSFAPGTVVASQRSGCPILPVAAGAKRAWRLRSWDRFMIPKPFAKVTVAYGEPTVVSTGSAREAVDDVPRFQRLLAETVDAAEA